MIMLSACLIWLVAAAAASKPAVDSASLQGDITTEALMKNLVVLNDIASANGGTRAFGTPGYAASVDYVWNRISKVPGAKAWKQNFTATFSQVETIELKVEDERVYIFGLTYSPSTSIEGITAPLILGPEGVAGCNASSYAGLDVADKIVLVQRFRCGNTTLAGRVVPAAAAGAAAVIVYNDVETNATAGTLSQPDPDRFVPAGLINLADGLAIKKRLEAGEKLQAYFQQTQVVESRTTHNVFVETESGDPRNTIMMGAHLDSVPAGPGINDDGSGTSLILEVFLALSKYSTKNRVRFAWWGAEEMGLLGSQYYCSHLAVAEINDILAYLNFDMVSKGFFGVGDVDGSVRGSAGPPGSAALETIYLDYFASLGIVTTPANLTNGSDYASFWGILNKPFAFLHTGTGVDQDSCYHKACDDINNPNPQVITTNAKAAAHMISIISMNGTDLIPKQLANDAELASINRRSIGLDLALIEEFASAGEGHMECGHDI